MTGTDTDYPDGWSLPAGRSRNVSARDVRAPFGHRPRGAVDVGNGVACHPRGRRVEFGGMGSRQVEITIVKPERRKPGRVQLLGFKGTPENTTSLGQLETAAAEVIAEVTGCDETQIKKQLRDHHQKNGLPARTKLRADPKGTKPNPVRRALGVNRTSQTTSKGI